MAFAFFQLRLHSIGYKYLISNKCEWNRKEIPKSATKVAKRTRTPIAFVFLGI